MVIQLSQFEDPPLCGVLRSDLAMVMEVWPALRSFAALVAVLGLATRENLRYGGVKRDEFSLKVFDLF